MAVTTMTVAAPSTAPNTTSDRKCMPRCMRESPTAIEMNVTAAIASTRIHLDRVCQKITTTTVA
jgi:hypothetical protein